MRWAIVVAIAAVATATGYYSTSRVQPDAEMLWEKTATAYSVYFVSGGSSCAAFRISVDGKPILLTAKHCVEGVSSVQTSGSEKLCVVERSAHADIAVLRSHDSTKTAGYSLSGASPSEGDRVRYKKVGGKGEGEVLPHPGSVFLVQPDSVASQTCVGESGGPAVSASAMSAAVGVVSYVRVTPPATCSTNGEFADVPSERGWIVKVATASGVCS